MASFSHASTEETTNANRVCRLLLGPCTDQLRDLLRHHVPTSTFPSVINHNSYKLPRLTLPQKNLILPNKGCYSGNYDNMDISLLYILLRNISGIPQHINGWGFDPVSTDRTASANIERIRSNRNQCVHSTNPTLTNTEFNLIWSSVRSAVVEIDNYLSNGNRYEKEVDLLRHETMDPVRDKHYRDELERQTKEDQATRDTVNELKRKCSTEQKEVIIKIQKIDNEISSMKSNSFPQNLRDHTRKEIEQHTRENTFVEIKAVRKFIAIHADKDVFLITGRPGIGKSKNGLDLLRQLGGKYPKYDVIKISDLHLVKQILNKDSRMILLLEDVFGKTNCKYSEDNDKSVLDKLQSYVSSGSVKVIFTIRSVVKKSLQYQYLFSSHRIFKGFEEVDLDSNQFKMSVVEKKRLLLNYCSISNIRIVNAWENENYNDETILDKNVPVRFSEATLINIVNIETYLGFPESCYMFTTNRALTRLGIQFFKHPSRFFNQEIDCLRKNGENSKKERICYITLVYILLSSNTLMINDFDERKVASILKSCYNREGFILKSDIVDAADEMTGSYLTYNAEISVFQFQHQTIFESIMLSYYKVDPILVLTMIDFEMIREIVKLCNYHAKKEEIRMIVPKELYGDLARRLCLIFSDQFSHMPSNFIKVICDSDLMTEIDADFINQLGEHFMEASNYNISTIITYDGKSEEVVFCLLAALLWYSTIKDWKTEDIKVILHSLKTMLLSETRSNVNTACKRTIVAAFLYLCDKKNTNDIIKFFLELIDELRISFDINKCFQGVVDKQNQPVASCILQHFSKKIDIVEVILETEREKLQDLINIFSVSFACSTVGSLIHDRARLIKWIFSSVTAKQFNMTEAVQTAGDKGLLNIVDWFLEKFDYKLFDCQFLLKEACGKGWENVVSRFLQKGTYQSFDLMCIMSAACQHSWHTIVKQLLQNSTLVTFDVNNLLTNACKKDDFEIVKSLIVYIGAKESNFNDDIKYVFEALQSNQSWSLSDFCTHFVKVLLKDIDSDKKVIQNENLESFDAINLLLNKVSETTFNFHSAVADVISNDVIHKQKVLQLFIDNNHIKQIKVSLLLLDACRMMNNELVTWLLKNIDNESLKVTTSFNESCTYGRLQIIKIMIQYSDHKLLNFSNAFLGSVKEEWRQHNEQNEEVMKFLLNTIDHSLFDFNTITKEIIILGQEDVMKILLDNVDIQLFKTEQVVDYACEQGLLEILEIFWKSENKEQINIFSTVSRALEGNKLDSVKWFRAFNKACKVGDLKLVIWILDNLDQPESLDIVKFILDKDDHNLIDLKKVLHELYNYCHNYENEQMLVVLKVIVENVDWKQLDMKTVMNLACKLNSLDIVECILDKVDQKLLDRNSDIIQACKEGNTNIVKCILVKVDHNIIEFKDVLYEFYGYCNNHRNERFLLILKVIVENVEWKRLDMKTVMNLACKLNSLDIVEFILEKVDHKLLDMNSAMIQACFVGNTDIVKYILDKVDHNLIDFKDVIRTLYGYCNNHRNESSSLILKVIVENVDWKQLDMKTVMKLACKLNCLDIVECILDQVDHKLLDMNNAMTRACRAGTTDIVKCILDKVDHTLLDMNSAMTRACEEGNIDKVKCVLDKVDHNLIDFKDVISKSCEYCHKERSLRIFKVIVENVDWKQLDMKKVMNLASTLDILDLVKCILDKVDHKLLDMKSAMRRACRARTTDIVKYILDKVDHNLIDFKDVISYLYECYNYGNESISLVLKVLVENVDWKQFDMMTVMKLACKLNCLDIVECILVKVDHKLLDMKSAMIQACETWKTDIVKYILDKVDHNLIDFKEVISESYGYCYNYGKESIFLVLEVLVENVDWKQFDMMTVMNVACKLNSLDIVEFILDKVDHKLLDMQSAMMRACEAGNADIVKCVLDKVDHNLIDFKDVISKSYGYCYNYGKESIFLVLEVLVENVDWKQFDMKTVMNLVCKLNSLNIVECILYKVDHKLLDINSAMIQAGLSVNTDIVKCILVKVDHNLIEFKDVLYEFYRYCNKHRNGRVLLILKVIVENVEWKRLDMKTVMNLAFKLNSLDIVECILEKEDHKLLDTNSAMIGACEAGSTDIVKCILDKVDHNLIDFKDVLYECYKYGDEFEDEDHLSVFEVIVKNVDWKRLDMKTVMNVASCKLESSDTVKCILDKVDHTLLNLNSAIINAFKARNIDTIRYLLDKVDHNLIEFKEILYEFHRHCDEYEDEGNLLVFQVIVENVDWKRLDMKTVMNLACKLNSLDIVEYILDKVDHKLLDINSAMMRACEAGNTDIIKCILDHVDHEMLDMNSGMTAAIKRHDLFIVKYLCNNVNKILLNMKVAFNDACKVGNLTLVKWILDNGDQSQLNIQTAMLKACRGPDDETVKLLYQRLGENMFDVKKAMNNACKYGNIDVIRWLWSKTDKQHLCDMKSALINACLSGEKENVEWLLKNVDQSQFDIQASITETFVHKINVSDVVITLLENSDRSLVDLNTVVIEACAIGSMEIVEWLLKTDDRNLVDINQALYSVLNIKSNITENDSEYNNSITFEKRLLVMRVLKKYSLSLFDMNNTVKEICRNGWTDILQWIWGNTQDHSLEIGPAINVACNNGHKELVEWALSNIDAKSLDTVTLMNESCGNGLLTVAKWMWENIEHSKLDMRTAMNEACSYSRIETAQWILENVDVNLLDTGNVLNEASKHGWLSVVKDLLKDDNLSQYNVCSALTEACMNGHLNIVECMFTKFGKDILDIESILPGLCSNPVNEEVAKFLISQFKNQLRLFANVMPQACEFGWTEVVEMLLENINNTEIEMKGPLLNACKNGEFDIVKIILSKVDHSELNIAEDFIVLCTRGWDEIVEFLLDELDHTAFDMKAALTEASRSGEEDIVQLLFKKVKPEKFDIEMAIDAASHNHMHENIVYQLLQRNYNATFELNRLKKKAEEYDWPKVLSTIRKFNSEQK